MKNIPQLFTFAVNGSLKCLLSNIVDDIIIAVKPELTETLVKDIDDTFKLGRIAKGSGGMRFFVINIIKLDY